MHAGQVMHAYQYTSHHLYVYACFARKNCPINALLLEQLPYPLNGELITVTYKFYPRVGGVQSASILAISNTYMQKLCVAMLGLYLRVFQRREVVHVTIIRLVFAVGDIRKPAKHGDCNQK